MIRRALVAAAFAAMVSRSSLASAQSPCSTVANPVYVTGGSGSAPLMRWVGAQLAAAGASLNIVFYSTTTCVALDQLLNAQAVTDTATYWLANGTPQTCMLPSPAGQVMDLALSGNGAALCPTAPDPLPSSFADFLGPISSVSMIVHHDSTESSISAEAIRSMYTMGAAANVAPWNDDAFIVHRNDTAFTPLRAAESMRLLLRVSRRGIDDVRGVLGEQPVFQPDRRLSSRRLRAY